MFTVYLIKVVLGGDTPVALALFKCCWVAKCLEKLLYKNENIFKNDAMQKHLLINQMMN